MELIENILKWYALICIFCTPFSVMVLLYMIKKQPKTVERINNAIDRFLDGNPVKEDNAVQTNQDAPDTMSTKSVEEQNEDIGIANLNLLLGDSYRCYLTPENIQNIGVSNLNDWKSSNRFVADFTDQNNDSVIHTMKAGKAIIYSGNIEIYHITVRPRLNGIIQKFMYCVLEQKHYSNLKPINKNKKILRESQAKRMITFDKNWDCPKMTFGWNNKGVVNRLLVEVECKNKSFIDETLQSFEEHFQKMDLGNAFSDVTYWYHGAPADIEYEQAYIDAKFQTVDFVAMVKKDGKGTCYIGITSIWRQGADVYEVYNNPQMTDRCFEGMIPDELMLKIQNLEPELSRPQEQTAPENSADKEKHEDASPENTERQEEAKPIDTDENNDADEEDDYDIDETPEELDYDENIDPNYDDEDDDEENILDDIDSDPF